MTRWLVALWQGEIVSALPEPGSASSEEDWSRARRWYAAMAGCEIVTRNEDHSALARRFNWAIA